MLRLLWTAFFVSLAWGSAADTRLDALMAKLQNRYEKLDTMKAGFTQSYQSKRFSDRMTESGVVYLRKGGLMKWEYTEPEKKVFVADGRHYFYYVAEDKQLIQAPAQDSDERSPALFLAGRGDFRKDFRAEWADPRPDSHSVKLTPVVAQPDFRYLIVDVDPVMGYVLRLQVVDALDNRTEYNFRQMEVNPKLPPDFFSFQPPPGTDIIYQRGENN